MTLIMGAGMIAVMLAFMLGMYRNGRANLAVFAATEAEAAARPVPEFGHD